MVNPLRSCAIVLVAGAVFLSSTSPMAAPAGFKPSPTHAASPPGFQAAMERLYQDFLRGKRDFSFENIEVGGNFQGTIPEIETRLWVHGRGEANLFRRKGPGDSHQFPPGRFSGSISDSALKAFLDQLRKGPFYNISSDIHGPREPVSRLYIRTAKDTFAFSWGFSAQAAESDAMLKADRILHEWVERACTKPVWSLTLKADRIVLKDGIFSARLRVVNRGSKTIHIVHPGSPGLGNEFGVTLKYAENVEEVEGYTNVPAIKWARYMTRPLPKTRLIPIAPGSAYAMKFSEPMEAMPSGWMGKFSFNSHLSTDTLLGKQVFNGTLYTESLSW